MTPQSLFARLHDATLLSVTLNWESGYLMMSLRTGQHGEVVLTGAGISYLEVPHRSPWGSSVSINEVRGPDQDPAGCQRVEIEMQSGDVIVLEGAQFQLQPGTS